MPADAPTAPTRRLDIVVIRRVLPVSPLRTS
jgi:hypothetical protein